MVMTASAIEVSSRKKEKAKGPRESEKILLGYYIKLGPGSQESCVYLGIEQLRRGKPINWNFGIKPFYPKIGGHVFTPKFGEERLPRLCQLRNRLHEDRYQPVRMRH